MRVEIRESSGGRVQLKLKLYFNRTRSNNQIIDLVTVYEITVLSVRFDFQSMESSNLKTTVGNNGAKNYSKHLKGLIMSGVCKQALRSLHPGMQNALVIVNNGDRGVWTFTLRDSEEDSINVTVWGSEQFISILYSKIWTLKWDSSLTKNV
ncbi:hypothetical protein E2986_13948 [Frieseomelitta varia]|uniref:MEIOB-like N-terminal domain-containing protein n=1 Tax=Frieseomelitta varia TaxID=561572 RepID=A0A833VW85_9HYME|nr:hypothetical protein E2986_13948 [Frieseomelitta varia]